MTVALTLLAMSEIPAYISGMVTQDATAEELYRLGLPDKRTELAPDLAVEVISPGDRPGGMLEKVADWLKAGTRLVWVVDLQRRQVQVYRADGTQALLSDADTLDGEEIVPGFEIEITAIV
jgi:Uma2 family endonuclease